MASCPVNTRLLPWHNYRSSMARGIQKSSHRFCGGLVISMPRPSAPQRRARALPLKTFQNRGIVWTGGSDFFVTPYPARYGLWSAIARETIVGKQPFGSEEAIDIHEARKAYTISAACQLFLEKQVGSLEAGKVADIAVWDRDPYSVPTQALKEMKCELTLLRGEVVFEDGR